MDLSAQGIERLDGNRLAPAVIDQVVESHMRVGRVTGLALAVLSRNEVSYVKAYGMREAAAAAPLLSDTLLYELLLPSRHSPIW